MTDNPGLSERAEFFEAECDRLREALRIARNFIAEAAIELNEDGHQKLYSQAHRVDGIIAAALEAK